MKKIFFALIVVSLFGCSASKVAKAKTAIYKKSYSNAKRWVTEYSEGKISKSDLNLLILGQEDYLKYFVDPGKKLK